eukprot:4759056-Amphidinium_carterae.1
MKLGRTLGAWSGHGNHEGPFSSSRSCNTPPGAPCSGFCAAVAQCLRPQHMYSTSSLSIF